MTRQELIDLVNINFADESNITAEELRKYTNALLDAFYPDAVVDNSLTESITTKSNLFYEVVFAKNGRFINVQIKFINLGTTILNNQRILTIKESEFLQFEDQNTLSVAGRIDLIGMATISVGFVKVTPDNGYFIVYGNLSPNQRFSVNFTLRLKS